MKLLLDPDTGELVEALPEDTVRAEPYDYADFRRAVMANSREHRQALTAYEQASAQAATAEVAYRKALALALPGVKAEHGATIAEAMAKGLDSVSEALDAKLAADALERAAMERIRLCRDDRVALGGLGSWSREANADGWRGAP